MVIEVLISCMHQKDASIISRSNIESDVLIINQSNENKLEEFVFYDKNKKTHNARIIHTTERGLSNSRNMAIKYSKGDICLICDDDEELIQDYSSVILNAYKQYPTYDILTFKLIYNNKKFKDTSYDINYVSALKVSSCQITFKRDSIINAGLLFDPMLGSGSGNGGGEENKFIIDALKRKLHIRYIPTLIARIIDSDSIWFKGFTNQYFINKGWSCRRILGGFWGYVYIYIFVFTKYRMYKSENSFFNAIYSMNKGYFMKR